MSIHRWGDPMSETRPRRYAALLIALAAALLVVAAASDATAASDLDRGLDPVPTTTIPPRSTTTQPGAGPIITTTTSTLLPTTTTTTSTSTSTTSTTAPTTTTSSTTSTTFAPPPSTIPRRPLPTTTTTTIPGTPTTTTTLPQVGPQPTGDEQRFLDLINGVRASVGLAPLQQSEHLADHARMWAQHLAATLTVQHSDLTPLISPDWRYFGENIGFGPSPEWIIDWLTNSPVHYANMTNPDWTHVGIGSYFDARGVTWSVHVFGAVNTGERPIRPR